MTAEAVVAVVLAAGLIVGGLGVGLWQKFAAEPRRDRSYRRARQALAVGDWMTAQQEVESLRAADVSSPEWLGRLNNLEGECLRQAALHKIEQGDVAEAAALFERAGEILGLSPEKTRDELLHLILSRLRLLVARRDNDAAALLSRETRLLFPDDAESAFWLGMISAHRGDFPSAESAWNEAREAAGPRSVEPIFFLGLLCWQTDRIDEARRHLADAYQLAPESPLVAWAWAMLQNPAAAAPEKIIAALQRSLSAQGLFLLQRDARPFWQRAFPAESFIARLTAEHDFDCPLLRDTPAELSHRTWIRLGVLLVHVGRNEEAVRALAPLLSTGPPTVELHRALGIAWCRLGEYGSAYTQLRAARSDASQADFLLDAYTALAAARATPKQQTDRAANVRWALRQIQGRDIPADPEAAHVAAEVFRDARSAGMAVPLAELLRLAQTFWNLGLADATTVELIDHLWETSAEHVDSALACLYAQASLVTGRRGKHDLAILQGTFSHRETAANHCRDHGWNLTKIERMFLERWAETHRGFPPGFDTDHRRRWEKAWLDEIVRLQSSGQVAAAERMLAVLHRLAPGNLAALDHEARLAWSRGQFDQAIQAIRRWLEAEPNDAQAHLRLAIMLHRIGESAEAIRHALAGYHHADESRKAAAAWVVARIALQTERDDEARHWLHTCLGHDPHHAQAFASIVALHWHQNDREGLASLASRPIPEGPMAQFAAALAEWAAGRVQEARERLEALEHPSWVRDARHLAAVIDWQTGQESAAREKLQDLLRGEPDVLAQHARALLGCIEARQGQAIAAVQHWSAIAEPSRETWGLAQALPAWILRAALESLRRGDDSTAAEWLCRADTPGDHDDRLRILVESAVLRDLHRRWGQQAFVDLESRQPILERACQPDRPYQSLARLLLARWHRGAGRWTEARRILRAGRSTDHALLAEQAALDVCEGRLPEAEARYSRILEAEPDSVAVRWNLFWTRLSLGRTKAAWDLWHPPSWDGLPPEDSKLLQSLRALMQHPPGSESLLASLSDEEESQLIRAILSVGRLHSTRIGLDVLRHDRPHSIAAQETWEAVVCRHAWWLFQRHDWLGCEKCLKELLPLRPAPSLHNLLGCVLAIQLDFDSAERHFHEAVQRAGDDPRLHQNLALVASWRGDSEEAELHWGRYLGTLPIEAPRRHGDAEFHRRLRFHLLCQLADEAIRRNRWEIAHAHLLEASSLRPEQVELLERLYRLQKIRGDFAAARQSLARLQSLRPNNGLYRLEELDCYPVRTSDDLECVIQRLGDILHHPSADDWLRHEAATRLVPKLHECSRHLHRLARDIIGDLDRLPLGSDGWYQARRELRRLRHDAEWLLGVIDYAMNLTPADDTRSQLGRMQEKTQRLIRQCQNWENTT